MRKLLCRGYIYIYIYFLNKGYPAVFLHSYKSDEFDKKVKDLLLSNTVIRIVWQSGWSQWGDHPYNIISHNSYKGHGYTNHVSIAQLLVKALQEN